MEVKLEFQEAENDKQILAEVQKPKRKRSAPKRIDGNLIGHWSNRERIMYFIFVCYHYKKFIDKELRRSQKMFKMMSKFIKTRAINQCRTQHHQNLIKYGEV